MGRTMAILAMAGAAAFLAGCASPAPGGPPLAPMPPGAVASDAQALVHEAVVDAPVDRVWEAFTTPAGMRAWMVAHAEVDWRIGGLMRTHYQPDGRLGDPGTIENQILAFEPGRMFAIRVHRAPANFPFPAAVQRMWTVVYFTPEGARTRVRSVGLGFDGSEESQKMRQFFDRGNAWTMRKLQEHFAAPAPR